MMVVMNGGVLVVMAALNLAVNGALGIVILLHCPHVMRRIPIKWPDCLRKKADARSADKGETSDEQSVD